MNIMQSAVINAFIFIKSISIICSFCAFMSCSTSSQHFISSSHTDPLAAKTFQSMKQIVILMLDDPVRDSFRNRFLVSMKFFVEHHSYLVPLSVNEDGLATIFT